ncbi:MAG: NAD(P)-dependent oxidoreductase, partial [Brevinema sp.]
EGAWSKHVDWCFWDTPQIELSGKTMGIIGYGNIGRTTGKVAQALNMTVMAYDRTPDKSLENPQMKYVSLEELFQKSDVIVLHCPLFPETEGIICKNNINKMKDGVIIINNSRGPLVNENDLAEALNSGKVYAAGLDVLNVEPMDETSPLATAKNCFITPHMSWAAKEARMRIMDCAVENLKGFLNQQPQNVVNK